MITRFDFRSKIVKEALQYSSRVVITYVNDMKGDMMMTNLTRRQFVKLSAQAATLMGGLSIIAGCNNNMSSQSSDSLKVGVMGPYTGDVAQYGLAIRNGVQLYVKQFNANGGVNGKTVDLMIEDEKGDSTEAKNVYEKMLDAKVLAIIGDVTSTPSIAVAQVSANDNMPLISASATAPAFTSFGHNAFRATMTDDFQGKVMAKFAQKQGYKTVGTIYNSGGDYESGINKIFVEECQQLGINVTSQQAYAAGDVDFNAQLTAIFATSPDAVFCPNYYQDSGKIVTQARQLGYKGVFLGADGWANMVDGDDKYASPEDLEGCYYNCPFIVENDNDKVKDFVKAYHDEYGKNPSNFCALGYDAAMMMCAALKTVDDKGDVKPGTEEYKQALIDAIAQDKVDGVTGSIAFEGTGDPVKSTLVVTFDKGKQKVFQVIEAK